MLSSGLLMAGFQKPPVGVGRLVLEVFLYLFRMFLGIWSPTSRFFFGDLL